MAKIGLTNLIYSNLTEASNGTPSYDGAKTLGKAVSANVSITNNSATLYADDAVWVFVRHYMDDVAIVAINIRGEERVVDLALDGYLSQIIPSEMTAALSSNGAAEIQCVNSRSVKLDVPAYGYAIYVNKK